METKNVKLIKEFEDWMNLKHLSKKTIEIYSGSVKKLLYHFNIEARKINRQQIIEYLIRYKNSSTYNHVRYSIQMFYADIVGQKYKISDLPSAKREQKLPDVLSNKEIMNGISKISNIKHRCIIKLLYGCGMRISDVINMKPSWIKRNEGIIKIQQGKCKKDRQVMLESELLIDLENYYKKYRPKEYLFNGQNKPQYSEKSIQNICKKFCNTHPHALRHSFATHLMETGVNQRFIQEMLGHSSSKTTERYTRVCSDNISKIKSPLSF